ncbi:MAG: hypothetical protein ACRDA3_01735 [Peptostreptococcaceae bacterium]
MNTINKTLKPFYIYTDKNCLYIKNINEDTEKLSNKIYAYSASIDNKNKIHICCIDTSGRLIHFYNNNGKWMKRVIHRFFNNVKNIKDLRLYITNHLFNVFIVESNSLTENSYKVSHISFDINNYKSSRFNINNILKDKEFFYKLNIDELSNIILEYKYKNSLSRHIFNNTLIFNISSRKWINTNSLIRNNNNNTEDHLPSSDIKDDLFEYCYSIKYKL